MTLRIIDWGERLFLVLLCAPFLWAFAKYTPTHPQALAVCASETLAVVLILIRRPGEMVAKPYPFLIAFLGTGLPLLARPGDVALLPDFITTSIIIAGLGINIWAKLSLNRSFGLVAANRGVKRGGPYRFVRHPMYLGYICNQAGFLLSAFSWQLMLLYGAAWSVQVLRIIEEEKVLLLDPEYRAFAGKVRYRIAPGF